MKIWSKLIYQYGQGGRCGHHNHDSGDVSPIYIILQYMLLVNLTYLWQVLSAKTHFKH